MPCDTPSIRRTRSRASRTALGGALAASLALAWAFSSPAGAADPAPDFAFFKEKIEPVLQSVCAQCHAGKGKGAFALVVHAPGVPFPDEEHKTNFNTVLKLLVPGKPDQSKFLLKPLSEKDGGVKHGGNQRIFKGTPAYKAWTDFIDGVKGANGVTGTGSPTPAPAPAPAGPGQPDFGYFVARVEPVLLNVCAQCHAGAGKGQFALITHVGGTRFPVADHRKNYDTVMKLLVPGHPEQSKFLLKPLAERDGGVKHQGGDRISKGDANYTSWTEFIDGVKGPPPPEDPPPEAELPTISDKGLVLEAEDMKVAGDAQVQPADGAQGGKAGAKGSVVAPGAGGGRVTASFRAARTGEYAISLRVTGAARGLRVRVDGGEPVDVDPPKEGFAEVSPLVPLDNGKPLEGRAGRLAVEGETVKMDGRQGMARFLAAADLAHNRLAVKIALPPADDPGRDDAWLLFDCENYENGKFFGLSDAGKKVVMGVIEGGRPRVLKALPRPEGAPLERLGVDLIDGAAVGRLDGKPVVFVNFDKNLGAARFGFLTHGVATVSELTAWHGAEEVHRMHPSEGGVFHLRRANHVVEIELLSGGSALDCVTVKEISP